MLTFLVSAVAHRGGDGEGEVGAVDEPDVLEQGGEGAVALSHPLHVARADQPVPDAGDGGDQSGTETETKDRDRDRDRDRDKARGR